jgi:hypothetical protein
MYSRVTASNHHKPEIALRKFQFSLRIRTCMWKTKTPTNKTGGRIRVSAEHRRTLDKDSIG